MNKATNSHDADAEGGEAVFGNIRHPRKRAFLSFYSEFGNKRKAAKAAGISYSTLYTPRWRDDQEFQAAVKTAEMIMVGLLEDEVLRRAVEGVEKPVGWYKGTPGGYVREQSDNLLIFALKALMPEKYRERVEVLVVGKTRPGAPH